MAKYFALFFAVFFSTGAYCQFSVTVAPTLLHVDYSEFDQAGKRLDEETGLISGINLGLNYSEEGFLASLSYGIYEGDIDYDGLKQNLQPHTTDTEIYTRQFGLALGRELVINRHYNTFYLFVDRISWHRNILPSNGVPGLFEKYQWVQLGLGMQHVIWKTKEQQLTLNLDLFKIKSPKIAVDLRNFNLGYPEFPLGEKSGYKATIGWMHRYAPGIEMGTELFFIRYEFARAETRIGPSAFSLVTITEPDSRSQHIGAGLLLKWHF